MIDKWKKKVPHTLRLTILGVLCIILLYSVVSTYTAYQTPSTRKVIKPSLQYDHFGRFDYIVYLKNNTVYNKTTLGPGEGIYFTRLVKHINASFSYDFQINADAAITGNYTIQATIQAPQWTKTYPIVSRTPFSSHGRTTSFREKFPIDYAFYEQALEKINEETGVPTQNPVLIIQSIVEVIATSANGTVASIYTPSINVSLNQKTIEISKELSLNQPGVLTTNITVSRSEVFFQRNIWTISSLILIAGMLIFMFVTTSTTSPESTTDKKLRKIKKKYGEWIIETKTSPEQPKSRIILVKSLEDLSKVSEELGKPILLYGPSSEKDYRFYVLEDSMMYEYEFKTEEKMIKVVASCPKCGTKNIYEDYPGKKINVVCPNCGTPGIVLADTPSKNPKWHQLFTSKGK